MANWRQIQARIRKAKNAADPVAKLSELYQKTRDAMVAFELAVVEDKAEHTEEAIRWYLAAAERVRRNDWRKKAEEALTRLGAPLPQGTSKTVAEPQSTEVLGEIPVVQLAPSGEPAGPREDARSEPSAPADANPLAEAGRRRRRRGRRGGRKHRRGKGREDSVVQSGAKTSVVAAPTHSPVEVREPARERREELPPRHMPAARIEFEEPKLPSERMAHGRASEPALASRLAKLESLLRRLLTGPLHRLDEIEDAPAGPGVFLLSDSDLTTSYYVEACKTLRIGLGNLGRSGRGRGGKEGPSLKARMAEHLEINESKVSDYLKKHCVVRWLQLDEDAYYLANFAIAVLRTPLNSD